LEIEHGKHAKHPQSNGQTNTGRRRKVARAISRDPGRMSAVNRPKVLLADIDRLSYPQRVRLLAALLSADRGEGLLVAGRNRIGSRAVASPAEHRLAVDGLEFDASGG